MTRIRKPVPINDPNRLCHYGCGNVAKFRTMAKKDCCESNAHRCPVKKKENSIRTKELCKTKLENGIKWKRFDGHSAWNKGLTKETSDKVRIISEKTSKTLTGRERGPMSDEMKLKFKGNGGYRPGSGGGKKGTYLGYQCDSSWELAYIIYNLEHDISFKRNEKKFPYMYKGSIRNYVPDFILDDGTYVEIKGYHNEKSKAKHECFLETLIVLRKNDMKPIIDYVKSKYGKDFVKLYNSSDSSSSVNCED